MEAAVAGLVVLVGVLVWSARWFVRFWGYKRILEVHKRLTRQVYACMGCDRELLPPDERFSCGKCETFDFCRSCWSKADARGELNLLHPHYLYRDAVYAEVDSNVLLDPSSVAEAVHRCLTLYESRPLVGIRTVTLFEGGVESQFGPDFEWVTYGEALKRALEFGEGLRQSGVSETSFLGLCASSSPYWMVTQLSCMMKGILLVPLQH